MEYLEVLVIIFIVTLIPYFWIISKNKNKIWVFYPILVLIATFRPETMPDYDNYLIMYVGEGAGRAELVEPIIKILLTDVWLQTIPLLRVIAITTAIWPLLFFNMNILWVKKRSDLSLKLEIINIIFRLGLVVALYKTGVLWVCIALCIAESLNFIVYASVVGKINTYGLVKQLKDLSYMFISAAVSALFIYYLIIPYIENDILDILVGFTSFIILHFILLYIKQGYEIQIIFDIVKKQLLKK